MTSDDASQPQGPSEVWLCVDAQGNIEDLCGSFGTREAAQECCDRCNSDPAPFPRFPPVRPVRYYNERNYAPQDMMTDVMVMAYDWLCGEPESLHEEDWWSGAWSVALDIMSRFQEAGMWSLPVPERFTRVKKNRRSGP